MYQSSREHNAVQYEALHLLERGESTAGIACFVVSPASLHLAAGPASSVKFQ
jgi:hypothetical protein